MNKSSSPCINKYNSQNNGASQYFPHVSDPRHNALVQGTCIYITGINEIQVLGTKERSPEREISELLILWKTVIILYAH